MFPPLIINYCGNRSRPPCYIYFEQDMQVSRTMWGLLEVTQLGWRCFSVGKTNLHGEEHPIIPTFRLNKYHSVIFFFRYDPQLYERKSGLEVYRFLLKYITLLESTWTILEDKIYNLIWEEDSPVFNWYCIAERIDCFQSSTLWILINVLFSWS
jgi:hypothetical protein